MTVTLRASKQGREIVDQARKMKGWTATAAAWYQDANTTQATLKRFRRGLPIQQDAFIGICQAVGIENWEEIVDDSLRNQRVVDKEQEEIVNNKDKTRYRGLYIPNVRCRTVWGRDELTTKLLSYLTDPQESPILSLCGVTGCGKTEAATQIARAALEKNIFADVLWVQARESELIESSIIKDTRAKALDWNEFLYQLSVQLDCSAEPEQVQRLLREKKLLVVLDNAETADIEDILSKLVRMLNPSRTLLTSRLKSNPQYVKLIECPGLEEKWSRRLLIDEAKYKNIPVLLHASDEQLHRIHEVSCGAPLALHFVVSRMFYDHSLDPVLSALEQADREVEVFYRFTLETAWQRITDTAKKMLNYMAQVDADVTLTELCGVLGLSDSEGRATRTQLSRWSLILDKKDIKGNQRYDLHPWVRRSVRSGLVERWEPSLAELERIATWK